MLTTIMDMLIWLSAACCEQHLTETMTNLYGNSRKACIL